MATRNKIGRLTTRIDALASRRWRSLTLESLTDDAWAKIKVGLEQIQATEPPRTDPPRYAHFSDTDLIRCLMDGGPGELQTISRKSTDS
jgi:hypothetical protein